MTKSKEVLQSEESEPKIKIKDLEKIEPKKYDWGESYPVVTAEETDGQFNAFYKIVRKPEKITYHKKSNENYLIIKGRGVIMVGEKRVEVSEFMSIVIPVNTPHQVIPETVMEIYVTSSPPVTKEDIFEI